MNQRAKTILLYSAGVLIPIVTAALMWQAWPIPSLAGKTDPVVDFANRYYSTEAPYTGSFFEYDDLSLYYVEAGLNNDEAIVFLHGFPANWFSFVKQLEYFRTKYRVIAIDGLGAGRSDAPTDITPYRLANMSAHIVALLDELQIDRAHFVGHDWGAVLAFGLAQEYPARTYTVTGISAPPQNVMLKLLEENIEQREKSRYIERLKRSSPLTLAAFGASRRIWQERYLQLVEAGHLTRKEAEQFRPAIRSTKRLHTHINWYRANVPAPSAISATDYWPSKTAKLASPALIIWGNDDTVFVPEFMAEMANLSDQLLVQRLDDTGHWPQVERAAIVSTLIETHLQVHTHMPN